MIKPQALYEMPGRDVMSHGFGCRVVTGYRVNLVYQRNKFVAWPRIKALFWGGTHQLARLSSAVLSGMQDKTVG